MIKSQTIKDKVYKFVHHNDVFIITNLEKREFENDWLKIENDGKIVVKGSNKNGYAWDGCSPKFNVIDIIIGTPDGRLDYNTEKQITYYASMFHDVLYQFKSEIKLSRKEVDIIFKLNLKKSKFKLAVLYYFFVRLFGGFYGNWINKHSKTDIDILEFSWINTIKTNKDKIYPSAKRFV